MTSPGRASQHSQLDLGIRDLRTLFACDVIAAQDVPLDGLEIATTLGTFNQATLKIQRLNRQPLLMMTMANLPRLHGYLHSDILYARRLSQLHFLTFLCHTILFNVLSSLQV